MCGLHLEFCGASYSNIEFGAHGNPKDIVWQMILHEFTNPQRVVAICYGITHQHIQLLFKLLLLIDVGLRLLDTYLWVEILSSKLE